MKRLFTRRRSFKGATFVPLEQPTTIEVPHYGSDDEPAMEVAWTVASEQVLSTIEGEVRANTESNNNSNKRSTPTKQQPQMPLAPKRSSPSVRKVMSSMIRVRSHGKLTTIETASTTSEATAPSMDDERFRPVNITVSPRKSPSRPDPKQESSPLQTTAATPKTTETTTTGTTTIITIPRETKTNSSSNQRQPPSPTQEQHQTPPPPPREKRINNNGTSPRKTTPQQTTSKQQQQQGKKKTHTTGRDPPKNNSPPPIEDSPKPNIISPTIKPTTTKPTISSPSRGGIVKTPSSAFEEPSKSKYITPTILYTSPNYEEAEENKNDETVAVVKENESTPTTDPDVSTETNNVEDDSFDKDELKAPGHHHLQNHYYDDDASSLVDDDPFVDSAFDYFYGESTLGGSTVGGSTVGESTYEGSTLGESTYEGSTVGESTYEGSTIGESTLGEASTVGDGSYYFRSDGRHGPRRADTKTTPHLGRQNNSGTITPSVDGESTLYSSTMGDGSIMTAGGDTATLEETSISDDTAQAIYRCAAAGPSGRRKRSKHSDNMFPQWKDVVVGLSHLLEDVTMCGSQAVEGAQDTVCQPMMNGAHGGGMNSDETKEERRRRQAWERMRRARKNAAAVAAAAAGGTATTTTTSTGSPSRGRSQTVRR